MIAGQQTLANVEPMLLPDQLSLAEEERPVFREKDHTYWLNKKKIPSATGILGILDKPALPWWGMEVGVKGVMALYAEFGEAVLLDPCGVLGDIVPANVREGWDWDLFTLDPVKAAAKLLTWRKLTVNHVRDAAGERGTKAHDQAEKYLKTGKAPSLKGATPEQKGYVQSVAKCLVELELEPVGCEVMVWHPEDRYAGTFDVLARDGEGRLGLLDYKTSKRVYDTHFLQLGGYEGMRRALKLVPVDFCAVLHITPDGEWERETHWAEMSGSEIDETIKDFEAIFRAHQRLEARKKRGRK